jgi:hypothetical protein
MYGRMERPESDEVRREVHAGNQHEDDADRFDGGELK